MNLKEQTYVCEIYKEQSLSKAAQNLYITQPALSSFLSTLEKSLGVALFTRTNRKLIPTQAGELYVETAQKMLRLQEQFYMKLDPLMQIKPGILRIGIQRIRAPYLEPLLVTYLKKEHPQIKLQNTLSGLYTFYDKLENNELDFVLSFYFPSVFPKKNYEIYPICDDQILLATPKSISLKACTLEEDPSIPYIELSSLKDQSFILQEEGTSIRTLADKIFYTEAYSPAQITCSGSIQTALQLCSMEYSLTFIMKSYLHQLTGLPALNFYGLLSPDTKVPFALITKKNSCDPKLMREIADYIKSVF